jgi:hypothetical protein
MADFSIFLIHSLDNPTCRLPGRAAASARGLLEQIAVIIFIM